MHLAPPRPNRPQGLSCVSIFGLWCKAIHHHLSQGSGGGGAGLGAGARRGGGASEAGTTPAGTNMYPSRLPPPGKPVGSFPL